jgi:hypothetical protein
MAKAKYLGLAFAAEWAIAVTLGVSTYAQMPSLNSSGVTEQAAPLLQIVVNGYSHDFGPGFYHQTG